MTKAVSQLFKVIPESSFKNKLRCFFYNQYQNEFNISFDRYFKVIYKGDSFFFVENPYHILTTNKDYLDVLPFGEGDTVLDCGAYVGVFSILASKRVGLTGKIIAFEPDPLQLSRLRQNIALNQIQNIEVIEKGLWSEETVLKFHSGKELASSVSIEEQDLNEGDISIPVTTIDTVIEKWPPLKGLFIKMNIEGSEIEALKGATATINRYKPYWMIRTNHYVNGQFTDKPVEAFLGQFNYNVETKELFELTTLASI